MGRGSPMQTFSGGVFYPMDPRPEDIRLEDIAAALSKLCRFGGQCLKFCSVAEHSVLVAQQVPPQYQLTALLHDASKPPRKQFSVPDRFSMWLEARVASQIKNDAHRSWSQR